jgi:hypothetical protein
VTSKFRDFVVSDFDILELSGSPVKFNDCLLVKTAICAVSISIINEKGQITLVLSP